MQSSHVSPDKNDTLQEDFTEIQPTDGTGSDENQTCNTHIAQERHGSSNTHIYQERYLHELNG